eukprot:TRINITY_DN9103_c0_g1_i1.p1 TRINITY_DN9103_c0_g1~~TRINITY_DN9103_c0_g1_i1.p1  ORF type:complete len:2700 (+),score=824.86 TRINITY_DN9103_c0_g1_i1:45-8144(+)
MMATRRPSQRPPTSCHAIVVSSCSFRSARSLADPYLAKDGLRMTSVLSAAGYTVHFLQNEAATASQLAEVLDNVSNNVLHADRFVFFIYAPCRMKDGEPYLLLYDAALREPSTWTPLSMLISRFSRINSKYKFGLVFALPYSSTLLLVSRTAQRGKAPSEPPKGKSGGFLHLLLPTGDYQCLAWPLSKEHPCVVSHTILLVFLGRHTSSGPVKVAHLLKALQQKGGKAIPDCDLFLMPHCLMLERPTGPVVRGQRATFVLHYVMCGAAGEAVAMNKHGSSFAMTACAQLAGLGTHEISLVPFIPGSMNEDEHWLMSCAPDDAAALAIQIQNKDKSVKLQKCWEAAGKVLMWFSSAAGVQKNVKCNFAHGPLFIGSAKIEMPAESFYTLETTTRAVWPARIPDPPEGNKVAILACTRYDISASDFVRKSTQAKEKKDTPEPAPVLPVLSVSMHSSAKRRQQITELGENILQAGWKGEEDGESSISEDEKPTLLQTTTTLASPFMSGGYPRQDTLLLPTLSLLTNGESSFSPNQILPQYGERHPKMDFLKVGDMISLLSVDGLLGACWFGDKCFPVTESEFGKFRIPKGFEKAVFQIERVTGMEGGPLGVEAKDATPAVCFGQPLKLMNVISHRYLCAVEDEQIPDTYVLSLLRADEMSKLAGDSCLNFKITPSSLMRVDGEKVRIGDNVEIVSLVCNGCVISTRYAPGSTVPIDLPPNLAGLTVIKKQEDATERGRFMQCEEKVRWTINSYYVKSAEEKHDEGLLYTGHAVLLFHKELEGFLTADYELDEEHKPFVTSDIGSCPPPGKNVAEAYLNDTGGTHKLYYDISASPREASASYVVADFPHSSNALWLIEYIDPVRGGPVGWLQNRRAFRIRHVASSGYLTVHEVKGEEPTLTISLDPTNPHTVVVFHPVNTIQNTAEEPGMLATSSYCRIQFVHSRMWLHIDMACKNNILGFSSMPKVQCKLTSDAAYEAVFAIRQASKGEFERLTTICTMRVALGRAIHNWVTERPSSWSAASMSGRFADSMTDAGNNVVPAIECLKSLIRFCSESTSKTGSTAGAKGLVNAEKQRILFSQNIHLWVLKLLQVPFQMSRDTESRTYTRLFQLAYQLLKDMIHQDVSLAVNLAPYIPFIESQLPYDYDAVKTLVGVYTNNYTLLSKLTKEQLVQYMSPTPYLDLLSCACICKVDDDEVGMQGNQSTILELIESNNSVIFPTKVHKGALWIKLTKGWEKSASQLLTKKQTASDAGKSQDLDNDEELHVLDDIPMTATVKKVSIIEGIGSDNEEDDSDSEKSIWSYDDGDLSHLEGRDDDSTPRSPISPTLHVAGCRNVESKKRKGWMPLREFITEQDFDNQPYVKHFEGTLNLWSMLCVDADNDIRSHVSREITFEEALTGIHMDFGLPECDNIRTAYATIVRYLYLGASNEESLKGLKRSVSISTKEGIMYTRQSSSRCITYLKKVLMQIIKENYVMVTECLSRNILLTEVLKLVQEMLKTNMYKASEMQQMLPWLLRLLDPSTDVLDSISTKRAPYGVVGNPTSTQSMWLNKILKRRDNRGSDHRQTFFGRKKKGSSRPRAKMTVFCHNEVSMVVMNAKVEVCKLILRIMDKEGDEGYDFRAWISEVKIDIREGQDMLIKILLETTLYEGNPLLYKCALEILYRSFSESISGSSSLSEIDDSSIVAMAKYVASEVISPKGPPEDAYRYVKNLFRHLKEAGKGGGDLCVALLRTFTKVLHMSAEGLFVRENGTPFTMTACQNVLDGLGLTADIAVLIESRNSDVIKHSLECGIALLEGGNRQVQRSLSLYFLSRDDEVLFKSLMDRIREASAFMSSVESGSYLRGRRASLKKNVGFSSARSPRLQTSPFLSARNSVDYTKSELYKSKNLFHTKEVMRYLQLFCEGHNTELQNYLREQGDNVHSFNLVTETLCFLTAVLQVANFDEFMAEVALQAYNTLTEYCQGPVIENQLCIVHGGMCLAVNAVFQAPGDGGGVDFFLVQNARPELVEQIRTAAVATVLSLLEGGTDQTIVAMMTGNQGLDLEVFRDTLYEVWDMKLHADKEDDQDKAEYALELGFSIFILFKTLQAYQPSLVYLDDSECTRYFKERTGRIEICRGSDIERVYFRIPELCVAPGLSERTKYELLWSVRRNTPTERIIDFFDKGGLLIYEMEYTDKWFTRDSTAAMLSSIIRGKDIPKCLRTLCRKYGETCELLMVYVAILVNVLIIVQDRAEEGDDDLSWYITLCTVVQMLLLSTCTGSFLTSEVPMLSYKRYRLGIPKKTVTIEEVEPHPVRSCESDDDGSPDESPRSNTVSSTASPQSPRESPALQEKAGGVTYFTAVDPMVHHNRAVLQTCLVTPSFYYYLTMLLLTVLGFSSPLFLSVHLVSIARASDVLHNVIRAVTQNGKALLLTCVLGMVVVYLFSVVAYIFFQDAIRTDTGEPVCTTLIRCFSYALTHGVRSDGGLGDHMLDPSWSNQIYSMQMAFEILFFVLVIVILLNIIFGIIIDTFAELRSQRQAVEEDIRTKCFICGIEASEFDRHAEGFRIHIKEDHNMWLYVFFLVHLRLKEVSEFNGQESYVYDKVKMMDLSFFPLNKALAVDHKKQEDEDTTDHLQGEEVMRTLEDIDTRMTEGMSLNIKDVQEIRNQLGELSRAVREISQSVGKSGSQRMHPNASASPRGSMHHNLSFAYNSMPLAASQSKNFRL